MTRVLLAGAVLAGMLLAGPTLAGLPRAAPPPAAPPLAPIPASGEAAPGDRERGDVELGAWLAGACVACHQPGAASGGVPAIAGLPEAAFVAAMEDYRSGARPSPLMHALASGLSDADIAALAAYFADLKPVR